MEFIKNMEITKTESINKRVALWVKHNINKIKTRDNIDDDYTEKILNYCDRILFSKQGEITVKYCKSPHNYGRLYSKTGKYLTLQSMMREYRHTLCQFDYFDIDIINAGPTIINSYCEKNDIECPKLAEYVNNREKIMSDMEKNYQLTRNEIKKIFIIITFGGEYKSHIKFITDLKNEFDNINDKILKLNPDIEKMVLKKKLYKNKKNIRGCVASIVYHEHENNIMLCADKFFTTNNFKSDVLCFDGLMIRKDDNINEELIRKLNDHVYSETGYKVLFIIKEMADGFKLEESDIEMDDELIIDNKIIVEHDREAVDHVLNEIKNNIIKSGSRYFIKNGNIYEEDLTSRNINLNNALMKTISDLEIMMVHTVNNVDTVRHYSKTAKGAHNILSMATAHLPDNKDFIKKMWYSNLEKICFLNGYWDFKEMKFKEFDEETISPISINRNYEGTTEEYKKIVYDRILDPILKNKEQQKYFLNWVARGMAGLYTDKTWSIGLGMRNTGKGVLSELIYNTLDSYAGSFNAEDLLCLRVSGGDTAKKMAWSVPMEFRRINLSNELKTEDESGKRLKLDGNVLKSIASGGDTQTARLNYKDAFNFKIQGRCLFFMNEIIEVSPADATETMVTFKFETEFKDEISKQEEEINKQNMGYYFAKSDHTIKTILLNDPKIQTAFFHILLDHYDSNKYEIPEHMQQQTQELNELDNNNENKLKSLFDFTGDKDKKDYVTVAEVNELCKNIKMSKSAYAMQLKRMGVYQQSTTVNLKPVRIYRGIRIKNDVKNEVSIYDDS